MNLGVRSANRPNTKCKDFRQSKLYMQKNTTETLQIPQPFFFPKGFPVQTTPFRIKRPPKK